MHPGIVAELASKTAEHGSTFLGEGLVGWRVALIAAIPAAILYEVGMALTRKITLRLPFLILKFTRLGMPKEEWEYQVQEWKAELWSILGDRERHWFLRFVDGMTFAIPLAAGGARLAAKASVKSELRTRNAKGPKRARHAARGRSASKIAMRAGVAGGVLGTLAAAGASQQGQSPTTLALSLAWFTASILGVVLAFTILLALWLNVHNRRRANRTSDHGK